MDASPRKARDVFLAAIKRPAGEREAYLREVCGEDQDLYQRVSALLQAQAEIGSFHEAPAPTVDQPVTESHGTVIGSYKLLEQIGEGGMGAVWMAQQTEPVRRLVAVKLIKAGMDTRQVIARFEAERQALALMDHPNIAKVLDGGTAGAGRPYFVMDLVKGVAITRYCDEHRLTPRQRLEMFLPVCQAVQHAHQKGIIHRDLKPSNVLVALYDGKPVPKVIDFGVAKAAGQSLTDKTLVTGFGSIVGTLEYMSPEQAEVNQLDIDTRSDIYSLGVLLYELLTGSPPFSRKDLERAGMLEMLRVIREQEPSKPSTKLSTAEGLPTLAANRGTEPAKLTKLVRGELDWIVMKALEKDRNRRYETANGFAMDVQRYLADEPVQACPPSAWYRCRKFARRNKGRLAAAALVLLFLASLGGVGVWAAKDQADRRAAVETDVGRDLDAARSFCREDRLREASAVVEHAQALVSRGGAGEEPRRRVAQARADVDMAARLEAIVLEGASVKDEHFDTDGRGGRYRDAFRDYGLDVTALDADAAAERIRASAIQDQLTAALDDWLAHWPAKDGERLLAVLRRADGDPWRDRLRDALARKDRTALEELARAPEAAAQPRATVFLIGHALSRLGERPLAVEVLRSAQQRHPDDFWINHELATNLEGVSKAAEAVGYYRAALALRPESPGVRMNLGNALSHQADLAGAVAEYRKAIDLDPKYAAAHHNLGNALEKQGKLDEAIAEYKEALRIKPDYLEAHLGLGYALVEEKKLEEAAAEFRKAIELDPKSAPAHNNLGVILADQGKRDEAIAEYREAFRIKPDFPEAHTCLGNALREQGKLDDAIAEYRQAVALKPNDAGAHYNLGRVLNEQGKRDGAIAEYRQAIALDPKLAPAHYDLGNTLYAKGRLDEAIAEYRQALGIKKDYPDAHNNLGNALSDKGQLDDAIAEYREALRIKPDHPEIHKTHWNLGNALHAKGRLDEAIAEFRKAIALKPDYAKAHNSLGIALEKKGLLDEAIVEFRRAIHVNQNDAIAHNNLGVALEGKGRTDDAIAEFREAIRLKKDYAEPHFNLATIQGRRGKLDDAIDHYRQGIRIKGDDAGAHSDLGHLLRKKGDVAGTIAEYQKAIEIDPKDAGAHKHLGELLRHQGKLYEAVAHYLKAIELDPKDAVAHVNLGALLCDCWHDYGGAIIEFHKAVALAPKDAMAHFNLGNALQKQGKLDGAVAAYRRAIDLDPKFAEPHYNLGTILANQGKLEEATAEYSQAIALKPDYAEAHCNLGHTLKQKGEFREALGELRRGHELGSKRPGWPYPSAQWVRQCERLVELDTRLPALLAGKGAPASAAERVEFARLCQEYRKQYAAAARLYAEAFATEPKLADELKAGRYNAACAAAQAGCGQGKDADKLDDNERARLRRQALGWLRADLTAWSRLLDLDAGQSPRAVEVLRPWLADPDLTGVRGPEALAKLPEAERQEWQRLWNDVTALLSRARGKTASGKK